MKTIFSTYTLYSTEKRHSNISRHVLQPCAILFQRAAMDTLFRIASKTTTAFRSSMMYYASKSSLEKPYLNTIIVDAGQNTRRTGSDKLWIMTPTATAS